MGDLDQLADMIADRLRPHLTEPLLWNVKTAMERTGIPRDQLIQAFHAGQVEGLWSAGRGRGSILLKPDSVREWIERRITEQGHLAPRGVKGAPAR